MSKRLQRYPQADSDKLINILAVDDNPKNLLALEMTLQGLGQNLVKAQSGEEALKRILTTDFALILLDVQMPGMDGFETAALIRGRERAQHVPIVFLTASSQGDAQMFRGYSLGAVDFLYKPIVPEILRAKAQAFVNLHKANQEVKRQAELLREAQHREHELEIVQAKQNWESERLRQEMEMERRAAQTLVQKADELARTMAEREVAQEATSRLAAILEATPDLVATALQDSSLLYMNNAGRRMLGISESENISELKFSSFRSESSWEFVTSQAWPHALKHGVWHGETRIIARDGHEIPVSQVIIAHKTASGVLEFVSTIARDISEHKQLEEKLRQSQKLEGIGQLAGGIAHDFNNLLTVILGRSQMLQMKLEATSPLRRDVDLIHKTAERAATMTRQLLAFSRKQLLQPRVLDLNTVVAEMEKILTRLIGEHVELTTTLDPGLGQVKVDPGQMEQVILNLAVNARDAMPDGGKLLIETSNVVLDESYSRQHVSAKAGDYVMLAVTDTGCGMDAQTRSRIFEPFFTTKEPGKGTGLGLATVYGIVKQSGGNIWVYSEIGRGSSFKVYLPRVDDAADEISTSREHQSSKGSETILLVEDEEAVRDLSEEILRDAGYRVLVARNGEEAIETCKRHEGAIELVITDVVMPKMSGPELARNLASLRPGVRILFLSGYTNGSIVHNHVLSPDVEFLQKPFSADIFTRKVRQILDARPSPENP